MEKEKKHRSVTYLRNHADEMVREVGEGGAPYVITRYGKPQMVLRSLEEYEREQETLALLKILALSTEEVRNAEYLPANEVFAELRRKKGIDK
jgi:prevent-host-death family protein